MNRHSAMYVLSREWYCLDGNTSFTKLVRQSEWGGRTSKVLIFRLVDNELRPRAITWLNRVHHDNEEHKWCKGGDQLPCERGIEDRHRLKTGCQLIYHKRY